MVRQSHYRREKGSDQNIGLEYPEDQSSVPETKPLPRNCRHDRKTRQRNSNADGNSGITPGIKWIKARNMFGVLVNSQRSGIFLRGEWVVR